MGRPLPSHGETVRIGVFVMGDGKKTWLFHATIVPVLRVYEESFSESFIHCIATCDKYTKNTAYPHKKIMLHCPHETKLHCNRCGSRGFALKEKIKQALTSERMEVRDLTPNFVDGDDYPKVGFEVARAVSKNPKVRGILVCGSGVGISIAANRVKGARALMRTPWMR